MRSLSLVAIAAIVLGSTPAAAQDFQRQRELNALRDIEASQRQQTEIMRRQAQRDSERAYRDRNDYVNAKRGACVGLIGPSASHRDRLALRPYLAEEAV